MVASAGAAFGIIVIIYLAIAVVTIVAWVKILNKAGYSGWWVLIGLVPFVNLVMFLVFAFSTWPSQRQQGVGYGPPTGGGQVWSPPPAGGYIPPSAGGYPPAAPGAYPPPQSAPQPPPPFSGGTV
ncbi:MAG TPA: DUF805 domain-containing protein [Acidimicrobiales bacterium]|nr:DUF805 domain-containing protein [Acidimicrobiales bacterium]